MKKGIDVATWNPITDYQKVKDAGVSFAIVKVINKSNKADSKLNTHVTGFKSVGISCTLGYTYSYANTITKAVTAANAFVKYAKPLGITEMWLDLEDVSVQNLGQSIVNIVNTYKTIATNNGMKFGVYTYYHYFNKFLQPYLQYMKGLRFWIARYASNDETTISNEVPGKVVLPTGIDITGWQYSSKCKIDGVTGYVDADVWYDDTSDVIVTAKMPTDANPFNEPLTNCKVGTVGNDADWVLWYLWRFGKLLKEDGTPDESKINSHYTKDTAEIVKEVQADLGFTGSAVDGVVGRNTRALFKKII
jgi:GH25 family lysozyme M1 (1,4-beta-N-acetylmuramidase)